MTLSLRERIESILYDAHSVEGTTIRILLAVKEELPSVEKDSVNALDKAFNDGWNACREEMERRLGLGTEPTNKKS